LLIKESEGAVDVTSRRPSLGQWAGRQSRGVCQHGLCSTCPYYPTL